MKVKIKKLHPDAVLPKYAKDGDAGMDLTAVSSEHVQGFFTKPLMKYGFGIAIEIPKGYVGLIFPRSSVYKQRQSLTNAVGVVDSGYRGEISVVMEGNDYQRRYKEGERIAQIIIMPYPEIEFEWSEELSDTERGTGGYGSSGNTNEIKSRCCGRCDGVNDICHSDRTCEEHKEIGCEICFGKR